VIDPLTAFRAASTLFSATEATITTSISDLARAKMLAQIGAVAPDWWGSLEIESDGRHMFSGSVLTAVSDEDGIRVSAASGIEMTEVLMGISSAEDFPHQDVVYAGAKAAGFSRERMVIQGLGDLPLEPIEVVSPLAGLEAPRSVALGRVTLLPPSEGRKALDAYRQPTDASVKEWDCASSFALVVCDHTLLAEAELEALEIIDASLAWLTVRGRFGQACLPDGSLLMFDREAGRSAPRRAGAISVRGLATNRRWLRDPQLVTRRNALDLEENDVLWPPLTQRLSTSERLALLAARNAILGLDQAERAAEISDAFEYYAADAAPASLFEKSELRRLGRELPDWLSDDQLRRIREVLGMANQYSLGQRLRAALQIDEVPITNEEWAVLQRVRKIRNQVAHGAEPRGTDAADLDLALSLLSRALVYRMARVTRLEQGGWWNPPPPDRRGGYPRVPTTRRRGARRTHIGRERKRD
jgi:hypothetical protein